ncbi:MAG: hypothetical protein HYY92_00015 [Parcubacteria group bacterium]|nr:hypothetical protein [Parcubacteria group bacterium]
MNPFRPKKDNEPRTLYATLYFAEAPFEDGHPQTQRKCTFSFRIIDIADVFPHSDIDLIQEGTIHYNRNVGQLHFRLAVCSRSNPEYIYTGVVQIDRVVGADLPVGVGVTEGNRWLRTVGNNTPTICKGVAQIFIGHPKLYRFLFGTEQKR